MAALRILIVDDSPEDRQLYRRLLAKDGQHEYQFVETGCGEEGLALARSERPDCVLLDYQLPDLDGLEFLTRLPAAASDDGMPPVIVLTGKGNERVAVAAMKSGAQDYLVKDAIAAQGLARAVANAIEKAHLRAEVLARTAELTRANQELRREIGERQRAERALQQAQAVLEELVEERTAELSLANAELKREVAERRRAEEERAGLLLREQEARRQAEEANRLKDEFLATLSHELRTPLNAILGWAHLLRAGGVDPSATAGALERIERNARAQAQLIGDLLDVSRIITGNLRIDMRPVELRGTIEAALDSVALAAQAKGITVATAVDATVPIVLGDSTRLQQVVWNLVSNAVKFTPRDGAVEVRVESRPGEVAIAVLDTGSGIDPDFLPYVFDRFRQADSTPARVHGGLGLGLAIVRHLVELHGGTVAAGNRQDGRGAIFTVLLPAPSIPAVKPGQGGEPEAAPGERAGDGGAALAGLRVLVVDDEQDTLELVSRALTGAGARVTAAASVAAALAALDRELPDVVVSDIGIPGEDGLSLIRRLRARPAEQGGALPAAALTAYARAEDRARFLAAGYQAHLAKPLHVAELLAAVAALGGRAQRG